MTDLLELIESPLWPPATVIDYGSTEGQQAIMDTLVGETKNKKFLNYTTQSTNSGLFDIILAYDLLDHSTNPVSLLKNAKELMKEDSVLILRLHPWISRSGGHLNVNKAFAHLIYSEKELESIGIHETKFTHRIVSPTETYNNWIAKAELNLFYFKIHRQPIEPFFNQSQIKERMQNKWMKSRLEYVYSDYYLNLNKRNRSRFA